MRIRNLEGYATCVYSRKRTQAPWRVNSGCENRARLFTGKHYELPNSSICAACPFYHRDSNISNGSEKQHGSPHEGI